MRVTRMHSVDETELLLYADGELGSEAANRLRSHLAGCAECHAAVKDRESVLDTFIKLRSGPGSVVMSAPPNDWGSLDSRIDSWENRKRIGSLTGKLQSVARLSYVFAGALALILIVLAISPRLWQKTISASELLDRAQTAQSPRIQAPPQSLLHETLQISVRADVLDEDTASAQTILGYESWRDPSGKLLRENSSSAPAVADLQRVYQANGLDWSSPLSAAAFEKWHVRQVNKRDTVKLAGPDRLVLTTATDKQRSETAICKAELEVRKHDWRPVRVRLWTSNRAYEVAELKFDTLPPTEFGSSPADLPASAQPARAAAVAAGNKPIAAKASAAASNATSGRFSELPHDPGNAKSNAPVAATSSEFPADTSGHAADKGSKLSITPTPTTASRRPSAENLDQLPIAPSRKPNLQAPPRAIFPSAASPVLLSPTPAPAPSHPKHFHLASPPKQTAKPPVHKPRKPGG